MVNPPSICFDCNVMQGNHMNFHEKTTIYLLNFKIGVLVFLFISGFFAADNVDSLPNNNLNISSGGSEEIYSTSNEEIERRKEEIDARLKQGDAEPNNGLMRSPFDVPNSK